MVERAMMQLLVSCVSQELGKKRKGKKKKSSQKDFMGVVSFMGDLEERGG